MGNKLLILVYFIIESFIVVSCQGGKSNALLLGNIDPKEQAPYTVTYQESLTGTKLNIPFHYTLQERYDGAPSVYDIYSYFSDEMIGSITIYKDRSFGDADSVALISNNTDIIKYEDENYKVYQVGSNRESLYLSYYKHIKESGVHIAYESNRYRESSKGGNGSVMQSQKSSGLSHPIVHDLRFVNGLALDKNNTIASVPSWDNYEKELTLDDARLFINTVTKIQEEVANLNVDDHKQIKFDQWLPAIMAVAVNNNDVSLGVFNKEVNNKELWGYLKQADNTTVSRYKKENTVLDAIYSDEKSLIASFGNNETPSQYIYLSVRKLFLGDITVLISMQTTTEPMARFYLSYFDHIQEVVSSSKSS